MAQSDNVESLARDLMGGRLTRRGFVVRAAGLGLSGAAISAVLAACGGSSPTTPAAGTTTTGGGAAATKTVVSGGGGVPASPVPNLLATPGGAGTPSANTRTGVDLANWNPQTIVAQAGTLQVDTKAWVSKVEPLDTKGKATFWYVGPTQADPQILRDIDKQFWDAFKTTYTGVTIDVQNVDYNQMLDKLRTAAAGKAAPDFSRMPILWGVEFAGKGQLQEVKLSDFGLTEQDFWPGALKSVMWNGKLYGIPTNNETMAFIWNKKVFQDAGLDPAKPPATWQDVVAYSKQIKDKTGKSGYGMVARTNAGNTPFRFMPMLWAYGSGALDEAEPNPTYKKVMINNDGGVAALQLMVDMYVRDKSVPTSALTNTQTENGDLFISEQIAMEIAHPSEYAAMIDKASKATGADKEKAQQVVANMSYGLIPAGPVRRAVVFGGSNMHFFTDEAAGHKVDMGAVKALTAFWESPDWNTRLVWNSSNPGNVQGFKTPAMKERLDQIKFLDVTTSMLPYGIPFPVIPESTTIMNNIVPDMLQNALTGKMTAKQAADDAADKIKKLLNLS